MSAPQTKRCRTESPQPMDVDEGGEWRKPKMRADVRRAVVVHALRVEAPQNVAIEEHVLNEAERWALQIRVLRMFFSCRSFSAVIFQSSERYKLEERKFETYGWPTLVLSDRITLWKKCGPLTWRLSSQYATSDSIARLLLFGQAHVRCLGLLAESKRSRGVFSEWPKVLSVLKQLRRLEAIDLEIRRCPKEMAVFHVLRNFLPACIVWMESQWPIDFLLASPKLVREPLKKAEVSSLQEFPAYAAVLRSNARLIVFDADMDKLAIHGKCERNETIETVAISQYRDPSSPPLWTEEEEQVFRSAFKNLRSLNDNFVLQIDLPDINTVYSKPIPAENFADELLLQKARGWIVEDWAKETGIPSLSLESMIRLPHPIMHFGEYKRVFAAVTAYFDEFPDHELKTEDFDADLIEKYRFTWDKPVCLWTHWKNGNRSRFLLTYNLLEVY